jgi:HD-GYP domain-containing protein (c-di-GMP phosphodiesterase class II)/DNA-binding CsgD family transcriptional regulator
VREVRLVEVLSALSLATDLGMGQPLGHAIRCCVLGTGLAEACGLGPAQRADVFHVALLRYIGCTADAAEVAAFAGDEIALAVAVAPVVMGEPEGERAAAGLPELERAKAATITAHCEAAALLAQRLGLGPGVVAAVRHGFERWDGRGHPAGLAGPEVPLPTRIAVLARDVDLFAANGGFPAAAEVVRARRGRAYDPQVVDAFCRDGERLLATAADAGPEHLLELDPAPVGVPEHRLDELLRVLADFTDAKLPYAIGHSRTVAELAGTAAAAAGQEPDTVARVRRAGWVHDLGRVGVSNRIWDKPGPLSTTERERVRLHPYLSEQVLGRCALLRPLAALAGAHHERADGSGYYRGVGSTELGVPRQILAAADAYAAMTQPRPHRPALTAAAAGTQLSAETRAGRFDPRAVSAVLAAAGAVRPTRLPRWPVGLTDREVEVLRLACRGATKQAVGARLGISAKTVNKHLESSYAKLGVTTRAAAALAAAGHELL